MTETYSDSEYFSALESLASPSDEDGFYSCHSSSDHEESDCDDDDKDNSHDDAVAENNVQLEPKGSGTTPTRLVHNPNNSVFENIFAPTNSVGNGADRGVRQDESVETCEPLTTEGDGGGRSQQQVNSSQGAARAVVQFAVVSSTSLRACSISQVSTARTRDLSSSNTLIIENVSDSAQDSSPEASSVHGLRLEVANFSGESSSDDPRACPLISLAGSVCCASLASELNLTIVNSSGSDTDSAMNIHVRSQTVPNNTYRTKEVCAEKAQPSDPQQTSRAARAKSRCRADKEDEKNSTDSSPAPPNKRRHPKTAGEKRHRVKFADNSDACDGYPQESSHTSSSSEDEPSTGGETGKAEEAVADPGTVQAEGTHMLVRVTSCPERACSGATLDGGAGLYVHKDLLKTTGKTCSM
jgi:hypothetical protein